MHKVTELLDAFSPILRAFERLFEHPLFKTLVAMLLGFIGWLGTPGQEQLAASLIILDWLTGLTKAMFGKRLKSKFTADGIVKTAVYSLVIAAGPYVVTNGVLAGMHGWAMTAIIVDQVISNLENIDEIVVVLGNHFPRFRPVATAIHKYTGPVMEFFERRKQLHLAEMKEDTDGNQP